MKISLFVICLLIIFQFVSCKKNDETPATISSCSTIPGSFEITLNGNQHHLEITNQTDYFITYNLVGEQKNSVVIFGKDQSDQFMHVEGILPNELSVGSHSFNSSDLNFDFFDISLDTASYYTTQLTIHISESELSPQNGLYNPIRGTFQGLAHSYPWFNGQPPADTFAYSGEFCLNGYIMN